MKKTGVFRQKMKKGMKTIERFSESAESARLKCKTSSVSGKSSSIYASLSSKSAESILNIGEITAKSNEVSFFL